MQTRREASRLSFLFAFSLCLFWHCCINWPACKVEASRGASQVDLQTSPFILEIILVCVRWYCKYRITYRNLAEMMRERGVEVTHRCNARSYQFLGKTLKTMLNWHPCSITTDKLGSCPRAIHRLQREGKLSPEMKHRTSNYLNKHHRGRPRRAQACDPAQTRLPKDEDSLRHHQGLRDHAHDQTPALHTLRA